MTVKKDDRNEKLIEELYEKLWWYTYDASEEEFDEKEVDAIVRLLDVLEPLKEDTAYEPGSAAAFERFKKRYGLEEEFTDGKEDAGKEERPEEKKSAEEEPDTAPAARPDTGAGKKRRGRTKKKKTAWKKRLIRIGIAAAACIVLMLTVNVGTYALKKKSFFEIVEEALGRTEVIVTGVVEDKNSRNFQEQEYSDWEDIEKALGIDLLQPTYLPEGFQLVNLVINTMEEKTLVIARYENETNYIRIEVDIFDKDFSKNMIQLDDDWELIEETGGVQYYRKNNIIESIFPYNQALYHVNTDVEIDELKKVIAGLS